MRMVFRYEKALTQLSGGLLFIR